MNAYVYSHQDLLVQIDTDIDIDRYASNKIFINKDKYLYNDFRQLKNLQLVKPEDIPESTKYIIVKME